MAEISDAVLLPHEAFYMGGALRSAEIAKAETDAAFKEAIDDMSAGEWANDDVGVLNAAQAARVSDFLVEQRRDFATRRHFLAYPDPASTVVAIGSRVTILFEGDAEEDAEVYDITSRVITGMPLDEGAGVQLMSAESPMARAIIGEEVGATVRWQTPRETVLQAMILGVNQEAQRLFYEGLIAAASAPPAAAEAVQ